MIPARAYIAVLFIVALASSAGVIWGISNYKSSETLYFEGWEQISDSPRNSVQTFTKLIKREPRDPEHHFGRGTAYVALGDYNRAELDFRRGLEINPKHYMSYIGLAELLLNNENYEECIEVANSADAHGLPYIDHVLLRGQARLKLGQFELALRDFTRFIDGDPESEEAHTFRARCYIALDEQDKAAADEARAEEIREERSAFR